jgi:hypothetical protein
MTGYRRGLVLLALATVSACGGGADGGDDEVAIETTTVEVATTSTPADTVAPTTTLPAVPASANPIDAGVEAKLGTAEFDVITAPIDVVTGDLVRTDSTGFAEVVYPDGSLTRLDVDTEFEIVTITDDAGAATTRTKLDTGRVWNRVQTLGEEDEFSTETSVATATVRGTAFVVECRQPDSCSFTALEGTVEIEIDGEAPFLLEAPNSVTVTAAGAGDAVPVAFDAAFSDPWIAENAALDVDAGFPSAAEMYEVHGPAFGSLAGTFTGERTIVSVECLVTPTCSAQERQGDVATRTYTFSVDCAGGFPCAGQALTQFVESGVDMEQNVPLVFDGATATWSLTRSTFQCSFDDGREIGTLDYTITWTVTPTAAEIRDDKYVVTQVSVGIVALDTVSVSDPQCDPLNVRDFRETSTATASRTA